jgi:hypothetical protein
MVLYGFECSRAFSINFRRHIFNLTTVVSKDHDIKSKMFAFWTSHQLLLKECVAKKTKGPKQDISYLYLRMVNL